jgi:4-hydroxy-tetrahydrodipicolinate reductase
MKIHLVGATGKMGQAVQKAIAQNRDFALTAPESADCILDFSSPTGFLTALDLALQLNKPLVSGTTGLSSFHIEKLDASSKKIPILYSPNFSKGIALLFLLAEKAKAFPSASVHIYETHHIQKKDSPSGTALKCQEILGTHIPISSQRIGETVGTHEIRLSFLGEELSLKHESYSRDAFAEGALAAVQFLLDKPPGLYKFTEMFA